MKAVVVLVLFACGAVNAPIPGRKSIEKLFEPTSCEYQLVEPLNALLYANYQTWTEVCNGSKPFFNECRDGMFFTCQKSKYSGTCSNYMYWIDAFVAGGKQFTCLYGYENIRDIYKNQDGQSCTNKEKDNLISSVDDIRVFLESPKTIACRDATKYMNATLTVLNRCDNTTDNAMRNLVQDFFEKVLDYSPCPNTPIGPGVEVTSVANTHFTSAMLLITAAMFNAAILFNT